MTCIVACIEHGKAYIAGDKAGANGFTKNITVKPKLFKKDNIIFGYTTSFRMGQILEHELILPERSVNETLTHYVYTKLVKSIIKCFKDNGFGGKDDTIGDIGGNFIFIIENNIFEMQSDFSIIEHECNFCSVGSGTYHATAAMEVLMKYTKLKPQEKLKEAIRVASKFVTSVSEECDIIVC